MSDFGIAKILARAAPITLTGSIIGTPAYMSPEQSQSAKVDGRSDIYALGVVLYELATGQVPFTADTPLAVAIQHINDPLPPPRLRNPALPVALEQTILKALAKSPAARYQTAAELVLAVEATARSEPLPPAPGGLPDAPAYTTWPRTTAEPDAAPGQHTSSATAEPDATPGQHPPAAITGETVAASGQRELPAITAEPDTAPIAHTPPAVTGETVAASGQRELPATAETVATPVVRTPPTARRGSPGLRIVLAGGALLLLLLIPLAGLWLRPSSPEQAVLPAATSGAAATITLPSGATDTPAQPTAPATAVASAPTWIAIGGTWSGPTAGVVHGETETVDGLYLYSQSYSDFTFAADLQALDREASLAFRMQDGQNGYLLIVVPNGSRGGNPGIYLAKRVQGDHLFLAATQQGMPEVGQWVTVAVRVAGTAIQVSVNDTLVFDLQDTATPHFAAGQVGFRIYGDQTAPCTANFRNIQLPQ